jgi:hypothetical protein
VELAIRELPNYLLAMRLSDEIGDGRDQPNAHARSFAEGESVFGRLVAAAAPALAQSEATAVARAALAAMVGSVVIGLDPEPAAAIRARTVGVLRGALVPRHVDAARFDAVVQGSTPE